MKSIMHNKADRTCYLCMKLYEDYSRKTVQEHHVIFGSGRRKLSERYGLKVYLCLWHHTAGNEAAHMNAEIANMLKAEAQKAFEEKYPEEDFLKIFGKNYRDIDTSKRQQVCKEGSVSGIQFLDDPVSDMGTEYLY